MSSQFNIRSETYRDRVDTRYGVFFTPSYPTEKDPAVCTQSFKDQTVAFRGWNRKPLSLPYPLFSALSFSFSLSLILKCLAPLRDARQLNLLQGKSCNPEYVGQWFQVHNRILHTLVLGTRLSV